MFTRRNRLKKEIKTQYTGSIDIFYRHGDLEKIHDIQGIIKKVREKLDSIDILINCAGVFEVKPFLDTELEDFDRCFNINVRAAVILCREFSEDMVKQKWGRIINVLNTGAKAPPPEGAPTAVSRAAGMALTKILAGEGAPHNVLVNAVLVGRIESDQWVQRHANENSDRSIEDFYQDMSRNIPLGRVGILFSAAAASNREEEKEWKDSLQGRSSSQMG